MSTDKKTLLKVSSDFYINGDLYSSFNSETNTVFFSNIELYGKENSVIYLVITSPFIKSIQVTNFNG